MTAKPSPASRLIERLTARGIRLVVGTQKARERLWTRPSSARNQLDPEDQELLRQYERELIAILRGNPSTEEEPERPARDPEPPEPSPREPEPPERLSRDQWDAVGLLQINGCVTHALGDQFARDVLTGKVPFAEAAEMERRATRQLHQIEFAAYRKE